VVWAYRHAGVYNTSSGFRSPKSSDARDEQADATALSTHDIHAPYFCPTEAQHGNLRACKRTGDIIYCMGLLPFLPPSLSSKRPSPHHHHGQSRHAPHVPHL
jgi:hypothetical protein